MGIADSLKFLDKSRGNPSFHERTFQGGGGGPPRGGGGGYVPREHPLAAEPPSGKVAFLMYAYRLQ